MITNYTIANPSRDGGHDFYRVRLILFEADFNDYKNVLNFELNPKYFLITNYTIAIFSSFFLL